MWYGRETITERKTAQDDRERGDPRLRVRTFAERVLLLSPASHWAVLINTNGWVWV